MEEGEDVFGGHGAGGFEFAALLAEEEFAIGIEDGDGGDAAVERHIVFFGDVEILVHLADVHVDNDERGIERGSDIETVEGFVEDVAIEAPVTAKDDQDSFAGNGGGIESFGDFLAGVSGGRIDHLAFVERLAEAGGGGVLCGGKDLLIALRGPKLGERQILFVGSDAGFEDQRDLKDKTGEAGAGIFALDDFELEIREALGFPGGPESELVIESERLAGRVEDLGRGGFGVNRGEGSGITGKDGSAPFFKRREGGRSRLAGVGSGGNEKREEKQDWAAHKIE